MAESGKNKKSAEELKKEQEEAMAKLSEIMNQTRPKNLREGVASGVNNIVAGAVGAAGVAVLLPTLGLAMGAQQAGLLGAVLGVTGGAVAGAVGAAALAVGGAVSGVSQLVRGVLAVPNQVLGPMQGKWWNENVGQWVETRMDEEAKSMENVPTDDNDILGNLKSKLDQKADEPTANKGDVVDMFYYEALDVASDAEGTTIKRRYYLLARQYHPDKNPDDQEAAEKFKTIAEAYQVLSDPTLRQKYDQDGRGGLSADKTSVADGGVPDIDPTILFAFLFGSDKFADYVGPLAVATSASVGDSPHVSAAEARTLQKRRVTRVALKLIAKITPWVDQTLADARTEEIEEQWRAEAVELSAASYGYQMVTTIGEIYTMVATIQAGNLENGTGLPGLSKWATAQHSRIEKRKAANSNQMAALRAGIDMMKLKANVQKRLDEAKTDDEKQAISKEMEESMIAIMLRIMWTTTVVDITSTVHEACNMIFFDQSVLPEVRKLRVEAVRTLGGVFDSVEAPQQGKEGVDAKRVYEEAAFAAMLETVKRKDAAAHESS